MNYAARLALTGTIVVGTWLSATTAPATSSVTPRSFLAPGAESYVGTLSWGGLGTLNDELSSPEAVDLDAAGNVWVADKGNHRVMQFTASGEFLFSFGASGSGNGQLNTPEGLAVDPVRNTIWVSDTFNSRVQKFDSKGRFLCQNTALNLPRGLAIRTGNGSVYVANGGGNTIVHLGANCATLDSWGAEGTGDGEFSQPNDIAIDRTGAIYVADKSNNRIQQFTITGEFVRKFAVTGSGDSRFTEAPQFNGPSGIAIDGAGDLFVSDEFNHRIQKFRPNGAFITSFGWKGATTGQLNRPFGLAVDGKGQVFVADRDNHRIQRFAPSNSDVTLLFRSAWGTPGTGESQFNLPNGVVVNPATGDVYVVEAANNRVQMFDAAGNFQLKWGVGGTGDGQFNMANSVAVDAESGAVYVSDQGNHRIQKFSSTGTYGSKWGQYGNTNGKFNSPQGVAVDPSTHDVYVADFSNHRVQRFTSDGVFVMGIGNGTTWTGAAPVPVSGNLSGEFNGPVGVAVDEDGALYVSDFYNHRIQKFDSTGAFVTRWGNSGTGKGQFSSPRGISIDQDGVLYVADTGNQRIQRFLDDGRFLGTWGSGSAGGGVLPGLFANPGGIAVNGRGNFIYVTDRDNNRVQRFDKFGFTTGVNPATQQVAPGQTATFTVNVKGVGSNTLNQRADLAILSGLPPDATASFAPVRVKPVPSATVSSTLSIVTSATTPPGLYSVVVEVTGGGQTRVRAVKLEVAAPG